MEKFFKRKKVEEEKVRLEEAYEEFRESFEEGVVKVSKTFIRGDVVNPAASKSATHHGHKPSSAPAVYKPSPLIQIRPQKHGANLEAAKRIAQETAKKIMNETGTEKAKEKPVVAVVRPEKPKKAAAEKVARLTNLEAFKEELKQMQAMRDERKGLRHHLKEKLGVPEEELNRIAPVLDTPYSGAGVPGNVDFDNDPSTTNLYVCNLPADTKIEDFFDSFGTFGPLASAKILYPKPDEERYRSTLSGFVAFMSRVDAERALCAMNGDVLRGCELRVSWARPVAMPPLPFYVPLPLRELAMPDPPSGLPFNAKPLSEDLRQFLHKYHDLPKLGAPLDPVGNAALVKDYEKMIENATVRVVTPTERPLLQLIHRVVEFLIRSGPLFEAILMARERLNPMYRFLFDNHHPTHVYYRWRLYSVLQGDDRQKWRLHKFRMFEGGSWWQPPPHALFELGMPPQLYGTAYSGQKRRTIMARGVTTTTKKRRSRKHSSGDSGGDEAGGESRRKRAFKEELEREEKQRRLKGILGTKEREELEGMLRNLSPEKLAIGDAMVWCLDHAECSREIAQCIYESLCIRETPLSKKIARIYLVSDILANCSARVKDAFYYRQHFGDFLQKIFIELNETLENIESRLKAEQFRQRVMLCFRNWEDHALYPTHDLIQWQNIFLGLLKIGADTDNSDGERGQHEEDVDEDIDGIPLVEVDEGGVDGMPMDEDGDGGDYVEEDPDLDGVPMDEGGTSAGMEGNAEQNPTEDSRFTTGSWSTVELPEPAALSVVKKEPSALNLGKSKWESVESSRWDRQSKVSAAFQRGQDDEEGKEPAQKRHRLGRHSPPALEGEKEAEIDASRDIGASRDVIDEEKRRRMLREIEVEVMKLQDELETSGTAQKEMNTRLDKFRQELMAKMEQKLAGKAAKAMEREEAASSSLGGKRGGESGTRRRGERHHSQEEREGSRRNSMHDDLERNRRGDEERIASRRGEGSERSSGGGRRRDEDSASGGHRGDSGHRGRDEDSAHRGSGRGGRSRSRERGRSRSREKGRSRSRERSRSRDRERGSNGNRERRDPQRERGERRREQRSRSPAGESSRRRH